MVPEIPLRSLRSRPGRFIHMIRPDDGLTRPYSLAGLARAGGLELHVAVLPFGRMSRWLTQAQGRPVLLRGPFGGCLYLDEPDEPLLLAGAGTGLAPLLGIVRDALDRAHADPFVEAPPSRVH